MRVIVFIILLAFASASCKKNQENYFFKVLPAKRTGLTFENRLAPTPVLNMFKYMYFYNGGGVGAGDFDNDGQIDLFFSANQSVDKLFLNRGNFRFEDITEQSGIRYDSGWSTGVSVVDINHDGWLDIYVCRVSGIESLEKPNELWVNKGLHSGVPYFENEAVKFGLDFSGYCTQAAFFDYDLDGDLDMFLLNHAIDQNGTFAPRSKFLATYQEKSGDRMYRNDGQRFTDVTRESKINSSAISFGLGVVITDINLDGWPDVYVGNDFHENDYLYINQKDGTFSDESSKRLMHTSMYSMGVDAGDFNNDGLVDIASMDMLPADPYMIRRSLAEDDYDIYYHKIKTGYDYQYTRNNLQLNRGNGMFSEIGTYAGVYATDWSWSTLWIDFNNDGWKDMFISNGIPKRMNDIDYVNFISDKEIQEKLRTNRIEEKDMALVNKFPEIKLTNCFFLNTHQNFRFNDISKLVEGATPSFSNGAIYADLDNDGDLDIVSNNVDDPASVYENLSRSEKDTKHYLDLKLKGNEINPFAVGAKAYVFSKGQVQSFESFPARGFQSSMQIPIHIGLGISAADSITIVWPDNSYQTLKSALMDTVFEATYQPGNPIFNHDLILKRIKPSTKEFVDITHSLKLEVKHEENPFPEFTREPLIPRMLSTEGPALAIADINHDGRSDLFLGSSKTSLAVVLIQQKSGILKPVAQPDLEKDISNEEVDACWADFNNDGFPDLAVANGGNEYFGEDNHLTPCIYLNDGIGSLTKKNDAFKNLFVNASSICAYDFDHDGDVDLFIGGRSVPWGYGAKPSSYLLANNGSGKFEDVTAQLAPELTKAGMITDASWYDMDKDGDLDLLTCEDWGGINVYLNNNSGKFELNKVTNKKGWWNFVLAADLDNDGDIDILAGNQGQNCKLKASSEEPVRLYYNDFDGNGTKEQVITYFVEGQEIPFMGKGDLQRLMPTIKKKFLYAEDYAKATLREIFSSDKLDNSQILSADFFSSALFLNDGKGKFTIQELPAEAQFSSMKCATAMNANDENAPDVMLFGNFYQNNIQLGRNDADFGTILRNKGNGNFNAESLNGLVVKGQVRHVKPLIINGKTNYVLAMNNDSLRVITTK
ncbi:MAG: VCBS repeat-containing protein [Bacteroidetes bacterium]|nr:VCBS repeat-containing protein [Bacteroidota bacterium]